MQTFLPYPSFVKSAAVLDRRRLGKQRVEVLQIVKAISDGGGWVNHPAVNMWRGYEVALVRYGTRICHEWIGRGYKDTTLEKLYTSLELFVKENRPADKPKWLGDDAFHASHRSNLLRKDFDHYSQFGWTEPTDLPYIWPKEK